MRVVSIKNKSKKSMVRRQEFFEREISDGMKGCTPGEWVLIEVEGGLRLVGFANPFVLEGSPLKVVKRLKSNEDFPTLEFPTITILNK